MNIFNISLSQPVVPAHFKATTIILVLKKSSPSCFSDYCPVALTPIILTKCFQQLVMNHIKFSNPAPWTPFPLHIGPTDQLTTSIHSLEYWTLAQHSTQSPPPTVTYKLEWLGLNTLLYHCLSTCSAPPPRAAPQLTNQAPHLQALHCWSLLSRHLCLQFINKSMSCINV